MAEGTRTATTSVDTGAQAPAVCPHLQGFDPLIPDQVANPWPWLEKARREAPVFYMPEYDLWCVTRHEDALSVYRDPITFSNVGSHDMRVTVPDSLAGELPPNYTFPFKGQLNTTDPPQHTRIRKLIQKAFTPRHVAGREPEIRQLATSFIDGFIEDGEAELTAQFAWPLPIFVIGRVLGIPDDRSVGFRDWAEDFFRLSGATNVPEEEAATRWRRMYQWDQFIRGFIAERRAQPVDDLVSSLIHAKTDDGSPSLTEDELLANILGIVAAGADTTAILITHAVYLLLSHPEQYRDLCEDRSLIPGAVEETMRLLGPVRGLRRTTTAETEIAGVTIPKGATLYLHVGSASRDEAVFANPNEFDIRRPNARSHLGFGIWAHFCVGAPLARLEAVTALDCLAERLPNMVLADPNTTLDYTQNMVLPAPRQLNVRWHDA